jgi:hypothetical protein
MFSLMVNQNDCGYPFPFKNNETRRNMKVKTPAFWNTSDIKWIGTIVLKAKLGMGVEGVSAMPLTSVMTRMAFEQEIEQAYY